MAVQNIKCRIEKYWGNFLPYLQKSELLKLAVSYPFSAYDTFDDVLKSLNWKQVFFLGLRVPVRIIKLLNNKYLQMDFFATGQSLFLINTPVHAVSMRKWDFPENLQVFDVAVSFSERVKLVFTAFQETTELLWQLNDLKKSHIISFKAKLFLVFNFYSQVLVAHLWVVRLEQARKKLNFDQIFCFESGTVAFATYKYTQKQNLKAVYIQHGLHDLVMPMLKLDEYYLWDTWDLELLKSFALVTVDVTLLRQKLPAFRLFTKESKNALIALEYETPNFQRSDMIEWWSEITEVLKRRGWRVFLRPHPRDSSDWYTQIKDAEIYDEPISLKKFFHKYDISMLLTIASASIFEALESGVVTFSKNDQRNRSVLCPFEELSFSIKDTNELEAFLKLNMAEQNEMIMKKEQQYSMFSDGGKHE